VDAGGRGRAGNLGCLWLLSPRVDGQAEERQGQKELGRIQETELRVLLRDGLIGWISDQSHLQFLSPDISRCGDDWSEWVTDEIRRDLLRGDVRAVEEEQSEWGFEDPEAAF